MVQVVINISECTLISITIGHQDSGTYELLTLCPLHQHWFDLV